MFRFFENINENEDLIKLSGDNASHIKTVLRLCNGDEIVVCDGKGNDYSAVITLDKNNVYAKLNEKTNNISEPDYHLTIFQALPKADKFELIIQKCVELGVYSIVPVITERVIVKADGKKLDRWQKISEAAAKQSQRGTIPIINEIVTLKNAFKIAANIENCAVAYEKNVEESIFMKEWINSCKGDDYAVFIGPEGGFSEKEISLFTENGITMISMGSRILRTETAPIVFAACLGYDKTLRNI